MGAIEFGEIIDQPLGGIEGARRIEHEVAQEHVQIAEVLRRLRLVQQAQRHLVLDPEHVAEPFGVAGEAVEVMHIAQALLELAQVQVEAAEVTRDVETALGHHVVLAHIGRGRAVAGDPEQAHQADDAAVIAAVFQHQGGPGRAFAQVLGGDFTGAAVLLVGPGAPHVGDQVAVAATAFGFARGGVEVDQGRRHQQRGHRIEQGRFARAGAADEQEAALGDRHFGQAGEGAPVVDLQAAHAELLRARIGLVAGEQDGCGNVDGHGRASNPGRAAARRRALRRRGRPALRAGGGTPGPGRRHLRRRTSVSVPARLHDAHRHRRGG